MGVETGGLKRTKNVVEGWRKEKNIAPRFVREIREEINVKQAMRVATAI